jgi:hypothetical protein
MFGKQTWLAVVVKGEAQYNREAGSGEEEGEGVKGNGEKWE